MAICAAYEWQEKVSSSCIQPDPLLQDTDLTCEGFIFNVLYGDTGEHVESIK